MVGPSNAATPSVAKRRRRSPRPGRSHSSRSIRRCLHTSCKHRHPLSRETRATRRSRPSTASRCAPFRGAREAPGSSSARFVPQMSDNQGKEVRPPCGRAFRDWGTGSNMPRRPTTLGWSTFRVSPLVRIFTGCTCTRLAFDCAQRPDLGRFTAPAGRAGRGDCRGRAACGWLWDNACGERGVRRW